MLKKLALEDNINTCRVSPRDHLEIERVLPLFKDGVKVGEK